MVKTVKVVVLVKVLKLVVVVLVKVLKIVVVLVKVVKLLFKSGCHQRICHSSQHGDGGYYRKLLN